MKFTFKQSFHRNLTHAYRDFYNAALDAGLDHVKNWWILGIKTEHLGSQLILRIKKKPVWCFKVNHCPSMNDSSSPETRASEIQPLNSFNETCAVSDWTLPPMVSEFKIQNKPEASRVCYLKSMGPCFFLLCQLLYSSPLPIPQPVVWMDKLIQLHNWKRKGLLV